MNFIFRIMDKTRLIIVFLLIGFLGVFVFRFIGLSVAIMIMLGIGGWFIVKYNQLQSLSQEIHESHSNILIAMKKRLDLANKLLDITANYADHEKMVQLGIGKIETAPIAGEPSTILNEGLVGRLMVMSRAYPELQANQTYQILMQQLEQIEHNLQLKRETYNEKVRSYNTSRTTIPMVFLAEQIGFHSAPYFDALTADAMEGMKDFKTADGSQLKTFLSGLGEQVVEKSGSITTGLGQAANQILDKKSTTTQLQTRELPDSKASSSES